MKLAITLIVGVLIVLGIWNFFVYGWHYETGRGDHTGYITAVEKSGIFFKTGTAYLKTNTTSTQEDSYCVIDSAVFDELQKASVSSAHINVHFVTYFMTGVAECGTENSVITSLEILPN